MSVWNNRSNTGLGDYIHYRRENYENHGIYRKYGKSSSFETAVSYAYQNLRQMARNRDGVGSQAEEIQNYLNSMRNGLSGRDMSYLKEEDAAEIKAKHQFLQNSIQEALSDSTTLTANMDNFDVVLGKDSEEKAIIARYSGLKDTGRRSIRRDTVIGLVDKAQTILNQVNKRIKNGTLNTQDATALLKGKNELNAIKKSLEAKLVENGDALIAYRNTIKTNTTEADLNEFGEVLKALYRVSRELRLPLNEDLGNVAEAGVAALFSMAGRKAKEVSSELIHEAVKPGSKAAGSKTTTSFSATFVDSDTLLKEINKDKNNKTHVSWALSEDGSSLVTIQTSQDTVDIHIDFPDDKDIFGLKDLNASVKNVGSIFNSKGVHVISETPLNSIIELTNVSFANHYLNLLSQINYDDEVEQGNEVITYALAVRALTGARSSTFTKKSDFFIVNSRSKNMLYVFSSEDLLKKICPQDSINSNYVNVSGLPKGSNVLNNKWMGKEGIPDLAGAQQRIAAIIAQTNRFKLSMSLLPEAFSLTQKKN